MQCKDCNNLGEKVACAECSEGYGWPCLIDKDGMHVNPEMRACVDFKKKPR